VFKGEGAMPGWLRKNIVTVLLGVIVGILGYFGSDKISSLEKKNDDVLKQLATTNYEFNARIQATNCELNTLSAKYRLEDFEASFLGHTMDSLALTSPDMERLKSFKNSSSILGTCTGAKDFQVRIDHMYNGLVDYIDWNPDGAIKEFGELPVDRAIAHQLLGTANYRKSLQFDPNSAEARKYRQEAEGQSAQFVRLAAEEIGGVIKQSDIARYDCNTKSRRTADSAASERAIQCLRDLVDKKFADYSTYYNLASVSSRLGRCQDAIKYLKTAAHDDTAHGITRRYILNDEDFAPMTKSPECGSEWESVLNLFL
jgi:tetratricopeptide (TPR) repeat protein